MIGDEMNLPRDGSTLSAEGAARSEAIRSAMLSAAGARHRRRTAVRVGSAAALVAVTCGAIAMVLHGGGTQGTRSSTPDAVVVTLPRSKPAPERAPVAPAPDGVAATHSTSVSSTSITMVPQATSSMIQMIEPDPAILKRLSIVGPALTVREIDDAELIALVEATGNRYGLERIGERVRMICLDCAAGFKGLGSSGDSDGAGGGAPSTN